MRFKLPQATLQVVDGYEHLDLIWAMDADERVWKRMVKEMGNPFGENRLDLESGVVVGMIPTAYF